MHYLGPSSADQHLNAMTHAHLSTNCVNCSTGVAGNDEKTVQGVEVADQGQTDSFQVQSVAS